MSFNFNIPLPLLESLKIVFEREGKQLAEEIACSLGLSKKDVVKKVFSKKTAINVFEWEGPIRCNSESQKGLILRICGRPTLLGTTKCILHQKIHMNPSDLPKVRRLELEDEEVLWLDEETNKVYNDEYEYVGWLKEGELYKVDFNCK